MSETKRKNFSNEFKAKVALEAISDIKTANEIGQEFGVHPTQFGMWKKELQAQASSLSTPSAALNLPTPLPVRSACIPRLGG